MLSGLKDYQVFAPAAVDDVLRFLEVDDPAQRHAWSYSNTNVPPKELMFPETETLFKYRLGQTDIEPEVPDAGAKRLVFGIRPCDALAYTIVDNLYDWDFPDPYYQNRRENTTLVGFACADPCSNCFCPSLGGGPASEKGLDALMFDLGDTMYVKTLTDKGEAFAKAAGLESAGDAESEGGGEAGRGGAGQGQSARSTPKGYPSTCRRSTTTRSGSSSPTGA